MSPVPLWSILALVAALGATAIPLIQERFRADGYALAFWNKVMDCALFLPLVVYFGVPQTPQFYIYTSITAFLYSIGDVLYFRAIPVIGSGMVTRLLPSSVLATFLLWFAVKPDDVWLYISDPVKTLGIITVFALFLLSGFFIKRCTLSWAGIRLIWPIILIDSIGPIFSKLALAEAGGDLGGTIQAPVTYLFFQALMMVACLGFFYRVKRPVPSSVLFDKANIRTGALVGLVMAFILILRMKALELADNPGLVSLFFFTGALWVLLIYRLRGQRDDSNIWAGLGILASAALVVVIKSLS